VYDLENKLVKEVKNEIAVNALDRMDPSQHLDAIHIQNFFDGITKGVKVNSEITGGHQSTLLCQLGNIALRSGSTLHTDPANGHILNNPEAMQYWKREYHQGWEPTV
jgi:hypothetical protein